MKNSVRLILLVVVLLMTLVLQIGVANAHTASNSFIYLDEQQNHWQGRLDLAVADLPAALPWQLDESQVLNWQAFQLGWPQLKDWLNQRLNWQGGVGNCTQQWAPPALSRHGDGLYLALSFQLDCAAGQLKSLDYQLLFADNPLHRGLVNVTFNSGETQLKVLTANQQQLQLQAPVGSSGLQVFTTFFVEGAWHLITGFDHLAFLLALLLPAVLIRQEGVWRASINSRSVLRENLLLVSGFTVAYSITLIAAALGWLSPPSSIVEPLIGVTVVVAGLSLLFPVPARWRLLSVVVFGLVHGFGFASMLGELISDSNQLILGLLGFNLGVEVAQITVVAIVLPLLFFARRLVFYRRLVLPIASGLISLMGLNWTIQALTAV